MHDLHARRPLQPRKQSRHVAEADHRLGRRGGDTLVVEQRQHARRAVAAARREHRLHVPVEIEPLKFGGALRIGAGEI
jgi:hypothetical protein